MTQHPILVATDFKPRSDRAVDRAVRLARETGRELVVVHAVEDENETKTGPSLQDRVASVMPEDAGSYRCLFPEGSAPRAIAQAVEDEDAFCLVIGVARYNSVGDFFLGTAIDLLLRRSPYPVLIAKERPRTSYDHIVIGTDLSDASKRGVEAAVRMFPQAQLHLVHAFHVPYEAWQNAEYVRKELASAAQEQCDSFTAQLDVSPECREKMTMELVEGSPLTAINKTIRKYDAHLCALTSHGYGGWRQALIGSTVSDLLKTLTIDTLVIHPEHEKAD
ncbi:universal stress protein [Citromicrobium bathyomarinum]|uniref:universal stress protein n=1 Tax=Citromicrobium TaxID=72173 RepID=UPI0003155279|nr:universal stress protein [Citromicrobium sp. JLT1363]